MSYEPTTWVNGDVITATKMNNIESGVQSVSSSYTPTTWVNGDIITAQKMNNIEQGIANAGGGGSSDFSTAEVTISVVGDSWIGAKFGDEIPYPAGQGTLPFSGLYMVSSSSPVVSVLTYQNEATIYNMNIYDSSGTSVLSGTYSTTGGITYDDENKVFVLTGDGTITLTV